MHVPYLAMKQPLLHRLPVRRFEEQSLGEHKQGRIKPGRIKRAALSLQNQNKYIFCFLVRPRLYASEKLCVSLTHTSLRILERALLQWWQYDALNAIMHR